MEQPPENTTPGEPVPPEAGKGLVDFFEQKITTWQRILNGMDAGVQKQALNDLVRYQDELTKAIGQMDDATWIEYRELLLELKEIVAKLVTDTQREYNDFREVHDASGSEIRTYYQDLINKTRATINNVRSSLES